MAKVIAEAVAGHAELREKLNKANKYAAKLEAELDRHTVEHAYDRGQRDFIQNDGRQNPYAPGTESGALWQAGFNEARKRDSRWPTS